MKRTQLLTISLSLLFMVAILAGHDSGQVVQAKMYDSTAQDAKGIAAAESKENHLVPPAQVAQVPGALFIENVGQFDEGARFQMWGGSSSVWLAEDGLRITVLEEAESAEPEPESEDEEPDAAPPAIPDPDSASASSAGVHLQVGFVDANPAPRIEPADRLQTKLSYLIGDDPALWRSDVPVYGSVRYLDLYPGIDLVVGRSPQASSLPWQLVVHKGADLSAVRLRVEGAEALALADNQLNLTTGVGQFTLPLLPLTDPDGNLLTVSNLTGNTPLLEGSEVSAPFATAAPEPAQLAASSTNNPADLLYSTFLGSSFGDYSNAIAVDGAGNAYVTGYTQSADFPTTPGAADQLLSGREVFVAKLNANGSDLIYGTFLGGGNNEAGHAIAVNEAGNAYVMGYTSGSFPTTDDAFDTSYNGGGDTFLVKLNADGSALEYATHLLGWRR